MIINSLFLNNFRNLKKLKLEFSSSGLLIYGKNGCGKTNLLEAISYFSFGKSFRYLSDSEIIEFGKNEFYLEGNFTVSGISKTIKIKASKDRKTIHTGETLLKKTTDLYKFIKVVYFSPLDIEIVIGYPANRRRFFDIAISQYNFKYLELLKQYNRVLKQRNALLKSNFLPNEKTIWDNQFIRIAKKIILQRLIYLEHFNKELLDYYSKIVKGSENVLIEYHPKFKLNELEIENILRKNLKDKEEEEKFYQRTMFGPHLHDFKFFLNNLSLKKYGSQGQKRSFVIALRLTQAKLIDLSYNDPPILIFDDIISELDSDRAHNIFGLLEDKHQIFIATPHEQTYSPLNIKAINLEEVLQQNET